MSWNVVDVLSEDIERLSPADRAAIAAYAARAMWPSGFVVYESGSRADGVFVVVRGCIILRNRVKAGRGFVPGMAGAGETFGSEGLARRGLYATDARADGETETLHLSSAAFRAYVREQPQAALALVGQVMFERGTLLHRMRELATLGVEQRLILALLRMSRSRAYAADGGQVVLGTTQYRLLCEMVGATRESVSLVLGRLGREGLVTRDGVRYIIAPPSALERRLDGPPTDRESALAVSGGDGETDADEDSDRMGMG
jgi:CRP-like cAMP-binding protein